MLVAGLAVGLFLYFVERAGVDDIGDGIRRLGWVFLVVVGLGGIRFLLRSAAWMRCLDTPHRLSLTDLFQAAIVGDALGNLTPLSIIVGEPAKGALLRHREPLTRTLPALALENLFYTLSAMLVIVGGLVAALLMFQTSGRLWVTTSAAVAVMVGIVATAHWIIWTDARLGASTLGWLQERGLLPPHLAPLTATFGRIEAHIHALYPRTVAQLVPLALLELLFHVVAVLETFIVLSVLSDQQPTILHAFVFESTNRFISFAFRFVPLRVGVDEAGSGLFADLLAFGTATGVTLAIVRKGRILTWIAIGMAILLRRGLTIRQIVSSPDPQHAAAVVVMARPPVGGASPKTRLAPAVPDGDDRRRLYAGFLVDTITACRKLDNVSLRVAHTPDAPTTAFTDIGIAVSELVPQHGSDLGTREHSVFEALFAAGFERVVMVGSDLPTLPIDHVRQALEALASDAATVVLGPAEDGGYYLMGLANRHEVGGRVPDLFHDVRWSTAFTLEDTAAAARRANLQVVLAPPWYDVDDPAGLERLREELTDPAVRARAPRTAAVLSDL